MLKNATSDANLKKSDRTRLHLMETALGAFRKHGYDACTMRELAKMADVTAPAFYYYFKSKEEIIGEFYLESLNTHLAEAEKLISEKDSLMVNLKKIILQRFEEFKGEREILQVLKRVSFDKNNELSPFHPKHKKIRVASVDLFEALMNKSGMKWPAGSRRDMAQLLWMFHLLILFYWIEDDSAGQKRSHELVDRSLGHLSHFLFVFKIPGSQKVMSSILETLKKARLLEDL
ncbi:MAG: TetR/AcrR family transcriptional regulator [Bdellovibrionota bacterium]